MNGPKASAALLAASLTLAAPPAHACDADCRAQDYAMGLGLGLGTTLGVAVLAPTAVRTVAGEHRAVSPEVVGLIAAGAGVVAVGATAAAMALTTSDGDRRAFSSDRAPATILEWLVPPLVLGSAAAGAAYVWLPAADTTPGARDVAHLPTGLGVGVRGRF